MAIFNSFLYVYPAGYLFQESPHDFSPFKARHEPGSAAWDAGELAPGDLAWALESQCHSSPDWPTAAAKNEKWKLGRHDAYDKLASGELTVCYWTWPSRNSEFSH